MTGDLFPDAGPEPVAADAPLADRLRPRTLDEILGQPVVEEGSLLRRSLGGDRIPSLLFWGPPGCGKTTLARVVADHVGQAFVSFSAVLSGVKEVRAIVAEAKDRRRCDGGGTVLFVDEIHRFNKSQQDAFLPHVEDGTLVLLGATTENPSFHINAALLSRCLVITLQPVAEDALVSIARRALDDAEHGLANLGVELTDETLRGLAKTSHGDARSLLNRLEALTHAAAAAGRTSTPLGPDDVHDLVADKLVYHDRSGEEHFNLASALQKSIRGGDPQAALYWLARSLAGGEEPLYVARRLVRMACEDVGLADPQAMQVALAAKETYRFLGTPEGELALAQAAVYLATAPKSNAVYAAFGEVNQEIVDGAVHPVPLPIRNAPTSLMKQLSYGKGYVYPHDVDDGVADQDYLPEPLKGRAWYRPSPFGHEKEIARRMAYWRQVLEERKHDAGDV
ncbi:MAG: AAA family ATPase [Planctomycetes bacterium]|nr:AAA family ATPase [Planctomycetota bacterium]